MPSERPSYPSVTLTVVVWVAIAVGASLFRPLIPSSAPSATLERYTAKLNWRLSVKDALREAAARNKPVALCLVNPSTSPAQTFEDLTTKSRDVIESLDRDFIPVRVNTLTDPALSGVFLSIDRAVRQRVAGLQVVALRPDGSFAGAYMIEAADARIDELKVVSALETIRIDAMSRSVSVAEAQDKQEAAQLRFAPLPATTDPADWISPLAQQIDEERFDTPGIKVRPRDWLALLDAGQVGRVQAALDAAMANHHFDWVGRKFLPERNPAAPAQISGRNSVAFDADMVVVLHRLADATGDPHYTRLAEIVTTSLVDRLRTGDSGSWSETSELGRPVREAWPLERLGKVDGLPAETATFWQLDPVRNPTWIPTPLAWRVAVDRLDQWLPALDRMAASRTEGVRPNIADRVDWCAYAVARVLLFTSGRERETLATVAKRLRRLSDPVWGALHAPGMERQLIHTPGDAGALALMLLSVYLATGDTAALREGHDVVARAEARFTDPQSRSTSGLATAPPLNVPESWVRPQVIDGLVQAPTTTLLEARALFSALDSSSVGAAKRLAIRDEASRLATIVCPVGRHTGGVVGLASLLRDGRVVLLSGPSRLPARFVGVPVGRGTGSWEDLPPGVYRLGPDGPVPYSPDAERPIRP